MKLNANSYRVGFTADLHLWHHNILHLAKRPFKDVMEMNEVLRDNHNKVFDHEDVILNLGDVALRRKSEVSDTAFNSFLRTFKGTIYHSAGNHNSDMHLIDLLWKPIPQLFELEVAYAGDTYNIITCHYALRTWNRAHRGYWHLYGHSHAGLISDTGELMTQYPYSLSMDVGVDANNYKPFTFEDVKAHMATKTFRASDHHSHKP